MTDSDEKPIAEQEPQPPVDEMRRAVAAKVPVAVCPFCRNVRWFSVQLLGEAPVAMLGRRAGMPSYTFVCTNCGFIRQHLRAVVDGDRTGEVEYAQPEG